MPMNARLLRPIASGVHPEANAWRTAVVANGGSVSASTMKAVSAFCKTIDTAGVRDRFYRLNLLAGDGLTACLVPLYRGQSRTGTQYGNTTDTNNNFVSGDYAETGASGGLTGASPKYLATGVNPNSVGIVYTDTHLSAYIPAAATTSGIALGTLNVNSRAWHLYPSFNGGGGYYRSGGTGSSGIENATYTDKTGLIIGTRTSATDAALYRKGVAVSTNSSVNQTDAFSANAPGDLGAVGGVGGFFYVGRVAAYSIGIGMSASQASSFHDAMQAFQTSLSRNA